jgi:hypothetical protein
MSQCFPNGLTRLRLKVLFPSRWTFTRRFSKRDAFVPGRQQLPDVRYGLGDADLPKIPEDAPVRQTDDISILHRTTTSLVI